MLIDWFTVAAQIVNFLVLVALLRHFLYGPIIRAMDRREEQVVSRLRDAESRWQEAEGEKQLYLDNQKTLDRQRGELLEQARGEAEELRRKLLAEVRHEVAESKKHWQAALAREREAFLKELRQRAGLQVFAVSAKALADLADAELEQKIIGRFIKEVGMLNAESRRELRAAARQKAVTIVSAFAIAAEEQQRLGGQLREIIGDQAELRFAVDPGLICGVRFNVHGGVVGWNLEEYLHDLEQDLGQALAEEITHGESARQEKQDQTSRSERRSERSQLNEPGGSEQADSRP
jgi:F-type H+-transporting ATPase subunit b